MAPSRHHKVCTARQHPSTKQGKTAFITWAVALAMLALLLAVPFWNFTLSLAVTQTQPVPLAASSAPEPTALAVANKAPCSARESFVERPVAARQETHLKLDLSQPGKAAFVSLIVSSSELTFLTDGTIKTIGELTIGDKVRMADDKTGTVITVEQQQYIPQPVKRDANGNVLSRVLGKSERWTETMLYLYTADDAIKTTPEHPFFVDGQWIEAQYLRPGQRIRTQSVKTVAVERTETRHDPQMVYSLLIEGTHNFYVGKEGLLAHNCTPTPWRFNPKVDLDWRGTGKGVKDALDEAFQRTGIPKEQFEITKWGRDVNGKSWPAEWRVKSGSHAGAEVNVDWPHSKNGPSIPHVGYQTPGKRSGGGAVRGHILLDDVPYNR